MSRTVAYSPNQYGAVVIFREGATEAEIAKAMNALKNVLDHVPERWSDLVKKFDNRYGSPVFYIP